MGCRWDEQNAQLAQDCAAEVARVTADFEAKLAAERAAVAALNADMAVREETFLSMQEELEAEVDDEVEQLKRT